MDQSDNQKYPELSSIIWRAIKDCADAQREAAMTSRDLILNNIMFENSAKNGQSNLRMLCFTYNADGEQQQLRMPLTSVVPAQFIQIKDVEIDFNVKIQSVENKLKVQIVRRPLQRLPSATKKQTSQTNESSIRINIKGRNIDMSSGMARVLQLATSIGTVIKPLD